jgi:hypothetical protein
MTRAGFRFFLVLVSASLAFSASPRASLASDAQTIRKALAKEPFKDLPGVKLPQKLDDEPQTVCSSYIGRSFWSGTYTRKGGYIAGLGRRIYRCNVDDVTVESTKQPDEIDWKKQKRYYKPWIDDGFDR